MEGLLLLPKGSVLVAGDDHVGSMRAIECFPCAAVLATILWQGIGRIPGCMHHEKQHENNAQEDPCTMYVLASQGLGPEHHALQLCQRS